jgi:general secretion pathway protein M
MSLLREVVGWPAAKRRKAAIGLAAVVAALALAIVALPLWLAHRHYDDALEDIDKRLLRYERLAAARPQLEQKLEGVRALDSRKYFLKASAASLSAAEVQDRVRQFIESAGGRVISVQMGTPRDEGKFKQVPVTVQANANVIVARRILYALETSEPYLFVDSLLVRAQVPPGYKPPPGFEPEMFIQFEVSGFAIPGAGS